LHKLNTQTKMFFSIEGPIAAGKSTILKALSKRGCKVYPEPTHLWNPWLEEFYKTELNAESAIILQKKIIGSLEERNTQMMREMRRGDIVVQERSLNSSLNVFTKNNAETFPHPGWNEVKVLAREKYEALEKGKMISIHLNVPFETIIERSKKRNDPDSNASSLYMRQIHDKSEEFAKGGDCVVYCEQGDAELICTLIFNQIKLFLMK